jgi:hypothetical protein
VILTSVGTVGLSSAVVDRGWPFTGGSGAASVVFSPPGPSLSVVAVLAALPSLGVVSSFGIGNVAFCETGLVVVFRIAVTTPNFVVSEEFLDGLFVVNLSDTTKILGDEVDELNSTVIFKADTRVAFLGAFVLLLLEISIVLFGATLVKFNELETFLNSTATLFWVGALFGVGEAELLIGNDTVSIGEVIFSVTFTVLICTVAGSVLLIGSKVVAVFLKLVVNLTISKKPNGGFVSTGPDVGLSVNTVEIKTGFTVVVLRNGKNPNGMPV